MPRDEAEKMTRDELVHHYRDDPAADRVALTEPWAPTLSDVARHIPTRTRDTRSPGSRTSCSAPSRPWTTPDDGQAAADIDAAVHTVLTRTEGLIDPADADDTLTARRGRRRSGGRRRTSSWPTPAGTPTSACTRCSTSAPRTRSATCGKPSAWRHRAGRRCHRPPWGRWCGGRRARRRGRTGTRIPGDPAALQGHTAAGGVGPVTRARTTPPAWRRITHDVA